MIINKFDQLFQNSKLQTNPFFKFEQNREKQNKQNNSRFGHGVETNSNVLQTPIAEANIDGASQTSGE